MSVEFEFKFKNIYENIVEQDHKGLHLVYSQLTIKARDTYILDTEKMILEKKLALH